MTDAPIALTVHDGHSNLPPERQKLIAEWLRANRTNPGQVCADQPIIVLTVPYQPATDDGTSWLIQIIAFHQFYVGPDGAREENFLTRTAVSFQRTVPLITPFPATPATAEEGPRDGEEQKVGPVEEGQRPPQHQDRTPTDEQHAVRPAETEEVQDRRPGPRQERSREGVGSRIPGTEEGRPQGRGAQVPQPEEKEVAR